jgi:hypothetical protein
VAKLEQARQAGTQGALASKEAARSALVREVAQMLAEWEESGKLYTEFAEELLSLFERRATTKDVKVEASD